MVNQSYQNFEVIVVNDGSTDSTQYVVDDYCHKYFNFKSTAQENQGVASARNTGMKLAKGDYIGFLDSDGDKFTENALKHFNDTIINNKMPDLVIGRQKKVDLWSARNYANTHWLSNSKKIEPYNNWIIWTMSLTNKVFSRKKILEIGLKMPLLSYASDGAFVLPFTYSCDNIVGCPHDIIIYNKRMLFDEYSISQTSSMKTLNDYLKVHEIIHEEFLRYSENYRKKYSNDKYKLADFEEIYLIYLDALIYRQVAILIFQFYRFFWRTDLEVIEKVKKCIESFKSEMFLLSWEKLRKSNKDLNLEDLPTEKSEMSKSPLVSIAIDNSIKGESLLQVLYNIHNFIFPSFEVFITEESFLELPEIFKKREYIKTLKYLPEDKFKNKKSDAEFENEQSNFEFKNKVIDKVNGEFLLYLDRVTLMSLDLLNKMFNELYNSHFDFAVMSVKYSSEKDLSKGEFHVDEFSSKKLFENDNYNILSNKLIKISFLKENKFKFTKNTKNDILKLYEIGEYTNLKRNLIIDTNTHIKNPTISIIIDNMDIESEKINELLKSIYEQNFYPFDVYLNENLKSMVSEEYSDKDNLNILENKNFKKLAIEESKASYGIFIDFPVTFKPSFLKEMFSEIEKAEKNNELEKVKEVNEFDKIKEVNELEKFSFVSTPIYQINNENKTNSFSSQEVSYFYKERIITPNKSKFIIFDLYLSNKLFNLEYLRENKIYFDNYSEDVLKIYRNSTSLRIYKKLIFTDLYQNKLFKRPFKDNKVPFSINFMYSLNKLFLIRMLFKKILSGAK